MSDIYYMSDIMLFAAGWAPQDFMPCDGRLLDIQTHQALFSLIGSQYGGDGQKDFALPDLRGTTPNCILDYHDKIHQVGQKNGVEQVSLTLANMPRHSHTVTGAFPVSFKTSTSPATLSTPTEGALLAQANSSIASIDLYANTDADIILSQQGPFPQNNLTISTAGAGSPIDNRQPYTAVGFYICVTGVYPPAP